MSFETYTSSSVPPRTADIPDDFSLLLVDDDEAFAHLCKRFLKRSTQFSFKVHHATNAKGGREIFKKADIDFLILDYHLPDGTGTKLLQELYLETDEQAQPPAIVLTASTSQETAIDAFRSQATDFMVKSDVSQTSLCHAIDNARSKAELRNALRENHVRLAQTCEELQKKNEEITRFYHTVSHEIKTPITAMVEFLQLLKDGVVGPLTNEQRSVLTLTNECCETITQHFHDLLEVTRFDTGKLHLDIDEHQIDNLVCGCVKGAQGIARNKGISLQAELGASNCVGWMDRRRIQQVIGNLIDNALKFTQSGGNVVVKTHYCCSEKQIGIVVSDTGCGIPNENLAKIFDRLYQVKQGIGHEAAPDGLGLGLCISQEIVTAHKGEISVSSTPGEGTSFKVTIPVQKAAKQKK